MTGRGFRGGLECSPSDYRESGFFLGGGGGEEEGMARAPRITI